MKPAMRALLVIAVTILCVPPAAHAIAKSSQSAKPKPVATCAAQSEIERALAQASSALEQARYEEAAGILQTITHGRCDARAYLLLAAACEAMGEASRAENTLKTAHSFWPANTSIATSLAREYMSRQEVEKAAQALVDFHATPETPRQELQEAAVVLIAAHRLRTAHSIAEVLYRQYPDLASLLLLANVLQLEGRYKDVNRILGEQRKTYADSADFLITLAESEYDAMLYDAACADLEGAILIDRNSYQAHYLLGNVLVAQNQTERAEQEYRLAIKLAPDQPRTYYQLALLLHSEQKDAGEVPLLAQALAVDSHYAPAHCEMGRILLARRQLNEAVTQLNLAIADNPKLEQAYYLLARAYAGLGEMDKANQIVKEYKALRASNRQTSPDPSQSQPLGSRE